jgi:hypothetical protein
VHDFKRRRMHRIAAEIAEKIWMLFQDDNPHPSARQQKAKHHSGWSTTGDAALRAQRPVRHDLPSLSLAALELAASRLGIQSAAGAIRA